MAMDKYLVTRFLLILALVLALIPKQSVSSQEFAPITRSNINNLSVVERVQTSNIVDFAFESEQLLVQAADNSSRTFARFQIENRQPIYLFGRKFFQDNGGLVALSSDLATSNSMTWTTYGRFSMIRSAIDMGFGFEYAAEYFLGGHQSPITSIDYDTSNTLYSGDESGQVFMWEAPENPEITAPIDLYNTQSTITSIDISATGQIAIGNVDGTLHIGSQQSFDQVIEFDSSVKTVAWHPDTSNVLAYVLSNQEIGMLSDGEITSLPIEHATALAWSPDGTQLAIGQVSGDILIWDVANDSIVKNLHKQVTPIKKLIWQEDFLASGSSDGLYLWDVVNEEAIAITIACCETQSKTDHNSSEFVYLTNGNILKWNVVEGIIEQVSLPSDYVPSVVTISSSGTYIAFYDTNCSELVLMEKFDGIYQIQQIFTEDDLPFTEIELINISPQEDKIFYANHQRYFASISIEDGINLWDTGFRNPDIVLVDSFYSSSGDRVNILAEYGTLVVHDSETGEYIDSFSNGLNSTSVEYSSDSMWFILVRENNKVTILEADNVAEMNIIFEGCVSDSANVHAALLSSKDLLFCASEKLEVWDIENNELVASFDLNLGNAEVTDIKLMNNERSLFIVTTAEIQHWQIVE